MWFLFVFGVNWAKKKELSVKETGKMQLVLWGHFRVREALRV